VSKYCTEYSASVLYICTVKNQISEALLSKELVLEKALSDLGPFEGNKQDSKNT